MTVSASTQIPKTSDFAVFQRQCKVLFEHILNDPNVEEFGTSGQAQKGIDLLGRRRAHGLDHWVGIQCKLTIKSAKLKSGKKSVVEVEGTSALSFDPALKELIIVTTAANDGALQREAAQFTDRQAKLGREFTVQVWGWETLCTHILRYEVALKAFMPDAFPHLDRVIRGQDKLIEDVSGVIVAQHSLAADQSSMRATLLRIERTTASIARQAVWDDRSVDTLLDRQIDQFRDMIDAGRPRTASNLLEGLWRDLPVGVEGRIRFRIKANIAACLVRLGEERKAAETYLEAYNHAPTDPKAVSLRVLAHLLLGQPEEALAFGRDAFTGAPDQGPLVAYMMTAAKLVPNEADNALSMITDTVADDPTVALAKLDYLRSRREPKIWWDFARDRHRRYPKNENLARAAAEARIDEAARSVETNQRRALERELRTQVTDAVAVLEQMRGKFANSEAAWDDNRTSLSVNLAIGLRLLRRHDEAKKVLEAALSEAANDQNLQEALLTISMESGDGAAARRALASLPGTRDAIMARLQLAANDENWPAILSLPEEVSLSSLETQDRALCEAATLLAQVKLGQIKDAKDAAAALLEKYPDEPIVPTVLYEAARHLGDGIWSTELFLVAFANRDRLNAGGRSMLARSAELLDDAERLIELLNGYVDVDHDSADLRSLARAFVNAPVRQASISFIHALPSDLSSQAFYARAVGSIHFNRGDLAAAVGFFQKALSSDSADGTSHLGLINTWLRQDRRDLVHSHLESMDLKALRGSAAAKMSLAQILVAFNFTERGLSFGYDLAISNRNDMRTVMLYIGLILPDTTGALIPSVGPTVAVDCWLKAERIDGRTITFVIDDDPRRNETDHFSSVHPFARLFLGQVKDASVISTPVIGSVETWRVVEIKHKYLALLHEFIETLPSRFPDAKGFYRFETSEHDVSSVLAEVKRLGEQGEQIFRHYVDDGYPLALAASLRGKCAVEFAGHVIERGGSIRACIGTNEERVAALRFIRAARSRGIVLDTYTAWVAEQVDLLIPLKALFPRVAVPQSSIDDLRKWQKRLEPENDEPIMTIGYADGQHFREEISSDRLREGAARVANGIRTICAELDVLPAAAPGAPSQFELKLRDIGDYGFLDPVYVSSSENLLLVSDDMQYRTIARDIHGLEGVWLQSVLMVAHELGFLNIKGYAAAVYRLTAQKHGHVTLNAQVLVEIVLQDESAELDKLRIAGAFIGNETADVESHFKVTWDFVNHIWSINLPYLQKATATSIMLDRLVGMIARFGVIDETYGKLIKLSRTQTLRDYLVSWARGHFIKIK
ncbi:hypothetical protein BST63_03455 [Bradyrhizobium canariense]|uniref:PIN domain-containing protein n=1 Tax=Bradyrhizobium canariense TaxID=255045 RepID=A0ABX3XA28_9BRAD|nr:hypothetical protein [Bradyrhizobium canariense]OSJ19238.1 hypothetical protein BSR47_03825 [Bradyrhizobium canariense]OSJ34538.1 hypothetical protein BST63_03455 [Bradyrhizobium canariense]